MYVKATNGNIDQYPYTVGMFRREHKNVSFPKKIPEEMMEEYGVYKVEVLPRPDFEPLRQELSQDKVPSLRGGRWSLGWSVRDISTKELADAEELKAIRVRRRRDGLLRDSDWVSTRAFDLGEPIPAEWAEYRAALRNIASHENFPDLSPEDWPTMPQAKSVVESDTGDSSDPVAE